MTTEISTPAHILEIIENKKQLVRAEQAAKAEADKREQEELFAKGSQLYLDARSQSIEKLPEWIRSYVDEPTLDIDDYVRLGRGWDKPNDWLTISIPGLSKILFNADKQSYLSARAWWNGYTEREPELDFHQDDGWRKDLEYVLCVAERAMQEHQDNLTKWQAAKEEDLRRYNQQEAFDQAADERTQEIARARAEQKAHEKAEEAALLDSLKSDPIALHLLKAFVLLRTERSHFDEQLSEIDEAMCSIENHWSRRAEELRRQADEAERRADDDRLRMQSDLDDAESKLKKAQRGW